MSTKPPLDPDNLVVEAAYFLRVDHSEDVLSRIKGVIAETLLQDGYRHVDPDTNPLRPEFRTMTFRLQITQPDLPWWFKLKKRLNLTSKAEEQELHSDAYHEQLGRTRPDIPFEIEFHFRAVTHQDGDEGYEVEVSARPVLLQLQHQQLLSSDEEYDIKSAVSTTKQRIRKYFRNLEAETLWEPYTEAELLGSVLKAEYRDILRETEYGRTAVQYIEEGDASLRHNHLNAALSCYIHAIEWIIIDYLNRTGDKDVIGQEKSNNDVLYKFSNLVDGIRNDTPATQRTISYLDKVNGAERRWIAHHKDGDTLKTDVNTLRERLLVLVDELFNEELTD